VLLPLVLLPPLALPLTPAASTQGPLARRVHGTLGTGQRHRSASSWSRSSSMCA
jgi:hypothetical protein